MEVDVVKEPVIVSAISALDVTSSGGSGERNTGREGGERERPTRWSAVVSSSTQKRAAHVSPDSQSERISTTEAEPSHEYPSFLT